MRSLLPNSDSAGQKVLPLLYTCMVTVTSEDAILLPCYVLWWHKSAPLQTGKLRQSTSDVLDIKEAISRGTETL